MSVTFAKLFRHSKFVKMGNFKNQVLYGNVVQRNGSDLYVDFGMKLNAVCKAPHNSKKIYGIGSKVKILLHDLELSHKFLGSKFDLTLLEADATIID